MRRLLGTAAVAALLLAGCAAPAAQPVGRGWEAATSAADGTTSGTSSRNDGERAPAYPAPTPVREVTIQEASLPEARDVIAPVRLDYGAIGASMPIDPVGVAPDGQMEIPEDALRAGWYRYAASPADDAGSVVVAAHAGSFVTPRGPLYDLRDARVGHTVELTDANGTTTTWSVTAVEQLGKVTIDFGRYFDRTGPRRLVLITCGGRWDAERQSYDDNIIVTAEPLS